MSADMTPVGTTLAVPSMSSVRTTFLALDRTVEAVGADCRSIAETLGSLSDALDTITQNTGSGSSWAGAGLVGLPIAGAIRAAKSLAGQYVKQQTGVPLTAWTELVASSSAQFDTYLAQLEAVAAVSRRHHGADLEPAAADQQVLLDARFETRAWKQILGRVAQLGQLVDAILEAKRSGAGRGRPCCTPAWTGSSWSWTSSPPARWPSSGPPTNGACCCNGSGTGWPRRAGCWPRCDSDRPRDPDRPGLAPPRPGPLRTVGAGVGRVPAEVGDAFGGEGGDGEVHAVDGRKQNPRGNRHSCPDKAQPVP